MDPAFFYTYVNTLVFYDGISKYNAIISFMNDTSIIPEYKLIPEINIELNDAVQLMNGIVDNQVNNQYIHNQNNNQNIHNNDNDYYNNPPPPPRLKRS
jgi:hypothetical protein